MSIEFAALEDALSTLSSIVTSRRNAVGSGGGPRAKLSLPKDTLALVFAVTLEDLNGAP